MSKPTSTSSLVHVVGISSSATAARMKPSNLLTANLFNGQMVNYFNLWDYKAAKMAFADGGTVSMHAVVCAAVLWQHCSITHPEHTTIRDCQWAHWPLFSHVNLHAEESIQCWPTKLAHFMRSAYCATFRPTQHVSARLQVLLTLWASCPCSGVA